MVLRKIITPTLDSNSLSSKSQFQCILGPVLTVLHFLLVVAARNIDFHHSGQLACEMLLSGLEPSQEPFLQKVISEMIKYELKNYSLGKVPVRDTAYLMGCADPTGRLERNQVVIIM